MSTDQETAAAEIERRPPSEDAHFIASIVGAAGDHDILLMRGNLVSDRRVNAGFVQYGAWHGASFRLQSPNYARAGLTSINPASQPTA